MERKSKKFMWFVVTLLLISIILNIRIIPQMIRYEKYMSQEIGNTVRPMASGIIIARDNLEEIVQAKRIDENQYMQLLNTYRDFTIGCSELRYFVNRVKSHDYDYFNIGIELNNDIHYFLQMFKYKMKFSEPGVKPTPEVKQLTDEEIAKFKIIYEVTKDYSNIFINNLGDYKTGELRNREGLYDDEYNINNETWIRVLQKIFKYNYESKYKNEF